MLVLLGYVCKATSHILKFQYTTRLKIAVCDFSYLEVTIYTLIFFQQTLNTKIGVGTWDLGLGTWELGVRS